MASVTVTCYANGRHPYNAIACAMRDGIALSGDKVHMVPWLQFKDAQVGVMYGWKHRMVLKRHSRFVYADMGYWNRNVYWRFAANGWSPVSSMRRGMPSDRLERLGVQIMPSHGGDYVLVLGTSAKSCADHGMKYMEWERKVCAALVKDGANVLYRPKPKDKLARPIEGTEMVQSVPFSELLTGAKMVVAHHSNGCVEAVAAGCAVHCQYGAASLVSVPLAAWRDPPEITGRKEFLSDVAYTQWTIEEMKSGAAWQHMREGVLQ